MEESVDLKMNISELQIFLDTEFPQMAQEFEIVSISGSGEGALVLFNATEKHLRPGNTVSGPWMFALADLTAYIAVLSVLGPVAQAVTTNCSIDFMRRPDSGLLMCRAKILKLGRRLVIIDGRIFSEGSEELSAARFSMTYARP
ncbi:MAG: hypothetical protein ACI8Y9_000837 [Paracoccaceae bacterium]